MRGFRLFERPLGVFSSHPPLTILGYLPDYELGVAYEGRLQYINNIGKCHVEIVEANLPPGHSAYVDNFNNEIVLVWPPYSPPDEEKPGIINGDFQSQNLEGWVDLRGNSWSAKPYESGPNNPYPPAPGNYAAWMEGVGRGDHVLESIKYSVTPGQTLMARSLWDQGPSNKDNNNLWTAFQFYNSSGGLLGGEVRGDRIHDRTNKSRHWSTVNTTVPGGAADVTVRLIAQRRNGRNRHIIVDDVQTSGLSYSVGTDVEEDYYVRFKLTDSANRVAYWFGYLYFQSVWYQSAPYPVVFTDDLYTQPSAGNRISLLSSEYDNMVSYGRLLGISLQETTVYKEYTHPSSEDIAVSSSGRLTGITITETTRYVSYDDAIPDEVRSSGRLVGISLVTTIAYVTYTHPVAERVSSSGRLTGITLT